MSLDTRLSDLERKLQEQAVATSVMKEQLSTIAAQLSALQQSQDDLLSMKNKGAGILLALTVFGILIKNVIDMAFAVARIRG